MRVKISACVYHHLPIFNLFKDGGGPLYVGKEMRERWPGRVLIYGELALIKIMCLTKLIAS